jgi:hypothetical protein
MGHKTLKERLASFSLIGLHTAATLFWTQIPAHHGFLAFRFGEDRHKQGDKAVHHLIAEFVQLLHASFHMVTLIGFGGLSG